MAIEQQQGLAAHALQGSGDLYDHIGIDAVSGGKRRAEGQVMGRMPQPQRWQQQHALLVAGLQRFGDPGDEQRIGITGQMPSVLLG